MSNLLLDEQPLVILPRLATLIGLNEAIVLQQLHYWVEKSKNEKDGLYWVYNTIKEWQEQFPFWSKNTIIRTFENLEKQGLVKTGIFNKNKSDRTKWYTIDYEQLIKMGNSFTQNGKMDYPNWVNGSFTQNEKMVNQRIPQNTTENTADISIPYLEIVDYLNAKAGTSYRHTSKKTQQLIRARWNEGFRLDDFKIVIDKKVAEWFNDPKMNKYLRPETLFGTKFESYLNQKGGVKHDASSPYSNLF